MDWFKKIAVYAGFSERSAHYDTVLSTNKTAREAAAEPDLTAFAAYEQTGGRGRRGRGWVSEKGAGLYLTVLIKPRIQPEFAPLLPLVTAAAVCGALEQLGADCMVKWPNDVVAGGKKICGILLERGDTADGMWAAAGMGVNITQKESDFVEAGLENATSLAILGINMEYQDVCRAVLKSFYEVYTNFCGNPSDFLGLYRKKCVTIGKNVLITSENGQYEAFAADIAGDGALIIEKHGVRELLYAGDVSVRGICGYV